MIPSQQHALAVGYTLNDVQADARAITRQFVDDIAVLVKKGADAGFGGDLVLQILTAEQTKLKAEAEAEAARQTTREAPS